MTMALEGGEGSASSPGCSLPPGKTRYQLYRSFGGPQGRSGQVRKISPPTGIRSPDRPAHSQSLYRLGYPAHTPIRRTNHFRQHTHPVCFIDAVILRPSFWMWCDVRTGPVVHVSCEKCLPIIANDEATSYKNGVTFASFFTEVSHCCRNQYSLSLTYLCVWLLCIIKLANRFTSNLHFSTV